MDVIVVGSIGIDDIETPHATRKNILGGSTTYACASASFFSKVGMVGVVGTDFPDEFRAQYTGFGVDLEGLQVAEGKTFRWSGVYAANMDDRKTLNTELNVFEHFSPNLPASYRNAKYVFLANIAPSLQAQVLDQVADPTFVMLDTMDLWINIERQALTEVISRVHLLTLNESEAFLLTDEHNLRKAAAKLLELGPMHVLIKRGGSGSMLFSKNGEIFIMPAYPVETVRDPTGAGDTFAGGFIGYVADKDRTDTVTLREAILHGNINASFGVEKFSLERLQEIGKQDIHARVEEFRVMLSV